MTNNTIVYQAYGNLDIIQECIYSLYSLVPYDKTYSIIIYTDNEHYFSDYAPKSLTIEYREVNETLIKEWRGGFGFVHRFKIKMLEDLLDTSSNRNILYFDTDTKIKRCLLSTFEAIANGTLFMHLDEGNMAKLSSKNPIFRKTLKYASSNQSYSQRIPKKQHMWNAGVLGFKSSDVDLIHNVLETTDTMYTEFPKHIVEQLAFSIVFSSQESRDLRSLEQEVFHYWNFKEFRQILSSFFERNKTDSEIMKNLASIDPEILIQDKLQFEQQPKYKRLFRKFKVSNSF